MPIMHATTSRSRAADSCRLIEQADTHARCMWYRCLASRCTDALLRIPSTTLLSRACLLSGRSSLAAKNAAAALSCPTLPWRFSAAAYLVMKPTSCRSKTPFSSHHRLYFSHASL